jgi:amino acid transporter
MRLAILKRALVGAPMPLAQARHERLGRAVALAVFASDPLSSVAYATEEILFVLILAGHAALSYSLPIALGIATLLAIVVISYRQTVAAYPQGGGAYLVAKDNLGITPALTAAASLLVDYVLTVSVSVAAGIAALTSAIPALHPYRVVLTSPYRSLLHPLLEYLDNLQSRDDAMMVTVVLPEFIPRRWWQHLLHNQTALLIKGALLFRKNTVVTDVPYLLPR